MTFRRAKTVIGFLSVASIIVRPVRCKERVPWRQLMNAHHYYLGFRPIAGLTCRSVRRSITEIPVYLVSERGYRDARYRYSCSYLCG